MADGKILNLQLDKAMNSPGTPMVNRLNLATLPTDGNTVVIGADTYEFRPVAGFPTGTATNIRINKGAAAANSADSLMKAINHVTDATIAYPVAGVVEKFLASQPNATTVEIVSAVAAGGAAVASSVATACTEVLTDGADVWDQGTCYGGRAASQTFGCAGPVTVSAAMITKGTIKFEFPFTPVGCILQNRMRDNVEAVAITGNAVVLTTVGGGAPNTTAADIIDVFAWA